MPADMDRHHRFALGADPLLDVFGVNREVFTRVGEDRRRTCMNHRKSRRSEGIGRDNDFASLNAQRAQDDFQGRRAATDRHRMGDADALSELALKFLPVPAKRQEGPCFKDFTSPLQNPGNIPWRKIVPLRRNPLLGCFELRGYCSCVWLHFRVLSFVSWRMLSRAMPWPEKAFSRRSEEHTSELQSLAYLVCRLLLE